MVEIRSVSKHLEANPEIIFVVPRRFEQSVWGEFVAIGQGARIRQAGTRRWGRSPKVPSITEFVPQIKGWGIVGGPLLPNMWPTGGLVHNDWRTPYKAMCLLPMHEEHMHNISQGLYVYVNWDGERYQMRIESADFEGFIYGDFKDGFPIGEYAQLTEVGEFIWETEPLRLITEQVVRRYVQLINQMLGLQQSGELNLDTFRVLVAELLPDLPNVEIPDGQRWFLEFMFGLAVNRAHEIVYQRNLAISEDQQYFQQEQVIVLLKQYEAQMFGESEQGVGFDFNMHNVWVWSALMGDVTAGPLVTEKEGRCFHKEVQNWHAQTGIAQSRLINVDGVTPAVGKSTTILALGQMLSIPVIEATKVSTLQGRSLKNIVGALMALERDPRMAAEANREYQAATILESGFVRLMIALHERTLGQTEGVGYCTHAFFGGPLRSRLTLERMSLFQMIFRELSPYEIRPVTSAMLDKLRQDLMFAPVVVIPDSVRYQILEGLRSFQSELMAVIDGGMGYSFFLDKPIHLVLQNLQKDAEDETRQDNHQRRSKYSKSPEQLMFMRLIGIVYADTFGIPLIQGSVEGGEHPKELPPVVIAWQIVRHFMHAQVITMLRQMYPSRFHTPSSVPTISNIMQVWEALLMINNRVQSSSGDYTPERLWTRTDYTEMQELEQRVLQNFAE